MGCGSSKVACSVSQLPISREKNVVDKQEDAPVEKTNQSTSVEGFKLKTRKLGYTENDLKGADDIADNASSFLTSAKELSCYLCNNLHSALLKVRCIWRWIAINIEHEVDGTTEISGSQVASDILARGKASPEGYAYLLKTLLDFAGVTCNMVKGWVSSHRRGMIPHVWNAVLIDGGWWLIDAYYSAGYVDKNSNFRKRLNSHYFLTDPTLFIFDHYPELEKWQLQNKVTTKEQFQNLAYFSSYFFLLKMRPITYDERVIKTRQNKVHLKFRMHKDIPVVCSGILLTKLSKIENAKTVSSYNTGKIVHIVVTLTNDTEHILELYAKEADTSDQARLVCCYDIDLHKLSTEGNSNSDFPKQHKKWMPGFFLFSPTEGILHVDKKYFFKISLPGAKTLAICLGGEHSSWSKMDNTKATLWEKEVYIPVGTERLTVVTKLQQERNTTFTSLLEYKVT